MKKYHEDREAVERSYMEGKMICGKLNGLNVGFEYCIYYDIFSVGCFKVRNIEYAEVIKKKKNISGFYHKVKHDISIELHVIGKEYPYTISINNDQLEYICGELTNRGVMINKKII